MNSKVGVQERKFIELESLSSEDVWKLDWVQEREHLMLILTFRHSLSCSASVHSFCKVLFSKATPTLNMLRAPFHIGF